MINLTQAAGSTFMEFDEVTVPAENLLGAENQGFEIIMSSTYLFSYISLVLHTLTTFLLL